MSVFGFEGFGILGWPSESRAAHHAVISLRERAVRVQHEDHVRRGGHVLCNLDAPVQSRPTAASRVACGR